MASKRQRPVQEVTETYWGRDEDSQLLDHGAQPLLQVCGHVDLKRLQLDTKPTTNFKLAILMLNYC